MEVSFELLLILLLFFVFFLGGLSIFLFLKWLKITKNLLELFQKAFILLQENNILLKEIAGGLKKK